jgi:hypothetical protein
MTVRWSHKKHEGDRLVSWNNPEDPSEGTFSCIVETEPFIQSFIWNGSLPEWRSSVWTGVTISSEYI